MLTKKYAYIITVVIMCIAGIGGLLYCNNSNPISHEIPEEVPDYLVEIPLKPSDFDSVLSKLRSEAGICELSEAYYLQPEFYADSWEDGKHQYEEHDYSRWLVHGYGAYPGYPKAIFISNEVGEEVQICTLYHTSWGVETYQGLKLVPEKNKYFDVVINPDEFLLPPTFPNFDEDWVKKLNITVKIKQKPPSGTYDIVVDVVNPSKEKRDDWVSEVLKKNVSIERMLEECIKQKEEKELDLKCEEWVRDRRNRYVETSNINIGERLIIKIIVEGEI
jgi:hypothetical protein